MLTIKIKKHFDKVIDVVFSLILVLIVIAISIGAIQLVASMWELLNFKGIRGHYIDIIADILTLYVLVELFRSLVDYFHTERLHLSYIIDAAIVFIIRELLIGLFKHQLKPEMIYAFSVLVLALGALRLGSMYLNQKDDRRSAQKSEPGQ